MDVLFTINESTGKLECSERECIHHEKCSLVSVDSVCLSKECRDCEDFWEEDYDEYWDDYGQDTEITVECVGCRTRIDLNAVAEWVNEDQTGPLCDRCNLMLFRVEEFKRNKGD